jgi:hypothetical protein
MGIYLNVIKFDQYSQNQNFSNDIADFWLSPLRGALSFCNKQPRVFSYIPYELSHQEESDWKFEAIRPAEKRMFSEQTEWSLSDLSLCKKIAVCACLVLGALLLTPLGLFFKAIALFDSDLKDFYKKLQSSLAYCEPNLLNDEPAKASLIAAPLQKDIVLHHIVPYFNDAKDVLALSRISKTFWRFANTQITYSKYAPFFSICLRPPFTLNQHVRNLFLGPFGSFMGFSAPVYSYSSVQKTKSKKTIAIFGNPELIPLLGENFSRRIPIAHRMESIHLFTKEEEDSLKRNIAIKTPYSDFSSHVILSDIHRWCSENINSYFKQLPAVFRLHVKGSFNNYTGGIYSGNYKVHSQKYDHEVFIVKYTLFHTEPLTDKNRIQHEYLLFKSYRDNWHCIDGRVLGALIEQTPELLGHVQRFPPLFSYRPDILQQRTPLCLHETTWRIGFSSDSKREPIPFATHSEELTRLKELMKGNCIPFHSGAEFASAAFVKIGHCSLEEMY